ncbi:MAG: OsmC family protein [Planctomycetes bacterium]|nr:OsmC family protein [Planctomycetota bacterium]
MVKIQAKYEGDLCCTAIHGPSSAELRTDAPKDNEGLGRYFSPTDLVATALATCVLTTMGIVARRHGIALAGATAQVEKHMTAAPRRIGRLPLVVTVPGALPPEHKKLLEAAAHGCPVHRSLHADVEAPITFVWQS